MCEIPRRGESLARGIRKEETLKLNHPREVQRSDQSGAAFIGLYNKITEFWENMYKVHAESQQVGVRQGPKWKRINSIDAKKWTIQTQVTPIETAGQERSWKMLLLLLIE